MVPPTRHMIAALAMSLVATTAHADIVAEHPRIYLTNAALPGWQAELPADPGFVLMQEWMDRRIAFQDAAPMLQGNYPNMIMTEAAFVAVMLPDDAAYLAEAKIYLATIASYPPAPEVNLTATRNQLYALAIGYDWLHDALTPTERTQVQDAIVAFEASIADLLTNANYVAGPSRWANVVALAGAVAIAGDDPRLDATLDLVLSNWRDGYNPALDAIGVGGGHAMGWMYGPAYSGFEAPMLWRTASDDGETWAADFLHDAAYFDIYAANGAYAVPPMEDCFGNTIQTGALGQMALSSAIFGNAHAEAFYQELDAHFDDPPLLQPPDLWLRLVTRSGAPAPAAIDALPLTRLFPGSGFLITRDTWSRTDATLVIHKASPFYSIGHHQRDEGTLYVDYRGPLLVDAGQYDGSGSNDHYRNFYSRTVAHNTLLVHWPEEDMHVNGFLDDGGQEVRLGQAENVEQMHGAFALAGIVGHSDADACVWSRSDTADTYRAEKLTAYTRDVLELRRPGGAAHPAILVVDRAELPVARDASVLWHFADGVEIDEDLGIITARGADQSAIDPALDGGYIRLDVLRPTSPSFVSFSGADRWTVNGVAHPPMPQEDLLSPYWGRVEVSPAVAGLAPWWSTLLRVGDDDLGDDPAPVDLGGADWIGARLGDTLFAIAMPEATELHLPEGAPLVDGCIAGLQAGAAIDVFVGDAEAVRVQANADGVAVYEPSAPGGDSSTSAGAADTTGGESGGGSVDDTAGASAASSLSGTESSGGAGEATASGDGCGCAAPRASSVPWLVVVLPALARRRRPSAGEPS